MFLAAGPYFQRRFESNAWISANFQSAELSVSTITNLSSVLVLTKLQSGASYPRRIVVSLAINTVIFTLLAASTRLFLGASAGSYFQFLMLMVLATSLATGLCQNGVFAYVSGLAAREGYTQAIMTGQAVAGVLPCIAQMVAVLSVPPRHIEHGAPQESSTSAFAYFLTATAVSSITLVALLYLLGRHRSSQRKRASRVFDATSDSESPETQAIPLSRLLRKLRWLASAVFVTFAVTMVFPVFTQQIHSVRPLSSAPRLFQPASFIPLAFLFWNAGDLVGRLLTAVPALSLASRPRLLFVLALSRVLFVPLYLLCNIRGHGALVNSDLFYLVVVQLLFGVSNGFIGSTCMMAAGDWVGIEEREAAGAFMSLCLVAGLTAGSLLSFLVGVS